MSKFKARYIIIPLIICGLMGGTAAAGIQKQKSKNIAKVTSVDDINQPGFFMDLEEGGRDSYIGTLKKGSVQYVKVNEELIIDDIMVKKGDTVKKGDKLFTYDLNSLRIVLAESEKDLKAVENEIKVAENELTVLKKLQPSENAPKVIEQINEPINEPASEEEEETFDEPIPMPEFMYEKRITAKTPYIQGNGSESEPYVYYVGEDTVVAKDALLMLCPKDEEAKYAQLFVCDETGTPMYARLVDGHKIDRETAADWHVNDGVTKDVTGAISFDGGSAGFASFMIQSNPQPEPQNNNWGDGTEEMPEMPEMPEEPEITPQEPMQQGLADTDTDAEISDEITEKKDNYKYSKEELKTMISDKEKEIEKLKMKKSQAELDVRKAKKSIDTGAEFAQLDGKVTFKAKDMKHLTENGAYMTITSSVGTSITSSIGEFSLSTLEIGKKVKISDYKKSSEYTGKVTYISDIPMTGKDEDTTQSYYEFVVTVEESVDLDEEDSVSITFVEEDDQSEKFMLDGIFVRSEGEKYYVMAANKDNIIEKRYVTVGSKLFFVIEVTGGISKDDKLAVAYGKTKEGMQAVDADYYEVVYGSSLFY